jgi:hypothetical protein
MDRLDEESADLDFLEENLKKTEALTGKMVLSLFHDILYYFKYIKNFL